MISDGVATRDREGHRSPVYPLVLLGLVLLAGCGLRPPVDASLVSDRACSPPCWNNIVPGVTDEDGILAALAASPAARPRSITVNSYLRNGAPLTEIQWQDRGGRRNAAYLRDGRVLRIGIDLRPSLSADPILGKLTMVRSLTLGELVRKRGAPETVHALAMPGELLSLVVELQYPAQGLTVTSYSRSVDRRRDLVGDGYVLLRENMPVSGVEYHAPGPWQWVLEEVYMLPPESVAALLRDSHGWPGFGRPVPLSGCTAGD